VVRCEDRWVLRVREEFHDSTLPDPYRHLVGLAPFRDTITESTGAVDVGGEAHRIIREEGATHLEGRMEPSGLASSRDVHPRDLLLVL